ncbi:ergosterol biosynthetic protein 28 homolog isoform X2 [Oratosquilla oratoria]|uniref:ergosterol biosynthetic protein 28 homolog isoform X2 n=1 Tax=Oratosquilla oratoria TaxID=337810 RepID=UPI003F75CAA6
MVHKVIYGLRGWIAFVAFMDLGTAFQCFIDADSFLGSQLYTADGVAEHVNPAMARLLGTYRVLSALIMTHCALCIHHKPVISLAVCTCLLTVITNATETMWYQTAPLNFYTLFPVGTAVLTTFGLAVAPSYLKPPEVEAEEETHMLRMGLPRRKCWNKKRT